MGNCYKVYCHTNKINGKKYIGMTGKKVNDRWMNGHGYREDQPRFHNAILKYGWDNFDHEILYDELTYEEAINLESELIAFLNTMNPQYGYNMTPGGECNPMEGKKHSEESKQKMSKSRSDIGRKNMRDSWNEERRRVASKTMTGENNPNYGLFGAENPRAISVYCPELDETFGCCKDVCEKYGINNSALSECINGKRKSTGKHPITNEKLHWMKIENIDQE